MRVTEESLYAGIAQATVNNKVVDVSRAVQQVVEAHGMHIVREYTGHGVGRQMHEAPQVLNYVSDDPEGQTDSAAGRGDRHRADGAGGHVADAHAQG